MRVILENWITNCALTIIMEDENMINKRNRIYAMENLTRRKKGSFYGERCNRSIPVMPSGQGHNTVPVSDLLALFDSKGKSGKRKEKL